LEIGNNFRYLWYINTKSMINIMNERKRKSEKLTKEEIASLKKYVRTFSTVVDASEKIGIHRNVLDMVLFRGSGSPETVSKIRESLSAI
jgi:hypothetical protein